MIGIAHVKERHYGAGDLASTTVGAVGLGLGGGGGPGPCTSSPCYMYLGTSGWIAACKPWSEVLPQGARHGQLVTGGGGGGGGITDAAAGAPAAVEGGGGDECEDAGGVQPEDLEGDLERDVREMCGGVSGDEGGGSVSGDEDGGSVSGGEGGGSVSGGEGGGSNGVFHLLHPDGRLAIVAASMVTAGGNAEWARRTFLPEGADGLAELDRVAAAALPGSDGLLYLPHLNGERSPFTDPLVRPACSVARDAPDPDTFTLAKNIHDTVCMKASRVHIFMMHAVRRVCWDLLTSVEPAVGFCRDETTHRPYLPARGGFVNLSPRCTRHHMCRAVLEGVAYNFRALAESLNIETTCPPPTVTSVVDSQSDSPSQLLQPPASDDSSSPAADTSPSRLDSPSPLVLVGGGARSRLWTQTLADVLGRPIKPVADSSTVAARGCAAGAFQYLGLWGVEEGSRDSCGVSASRHAAAPPPAGYFPGEQQQQQQGEVVVYPDETTRERHEANYAVFVRLHAALAGAGVGDLAS